MKLPILSICVLLTSVATAFPPAPYHEVYGRVRDANGTPLPGDATVLINGPSGVVISGLVDPGIGIGVNYSLKVPMDAGTQGQLYQSSALLPAMPFTVEVIIGGTSHVPIEVQGGPQTIGVPGGRTRLDLTLGIDSDGDGLPDAWEQVLIATTGADSLADVTPEGDLDNDGVSNFLEYLAGTYAFTGLAVFRLEIIEVKDGFARMRFLAAAGRDYTVSSATDVQGFEQVAFSFNADGSDEQNAHHSESIRFEEIYVPAADAHAKLFRLHVY